MTVLILLVRTSLRIINIALICALNMAHSTITSRALCFRWPVRKGGQWSLYGTGKGNTEQLASKTHLNLAGDTVDTFSAAKWSASKSFDSDGLRLGDWYMPQMDECFDIFAPMKLDGSDPVNATLKKNDGKCPLFVGVPLGSRA